MRCSATMLSAAVAAGPPPGRAADAGILDSLQRLLGEADGADPSAFKAACELLATSGSDEEQSALLRTLIIQGHTHGELPPGKSATSSHALQKALELCRWHLCAGGGAPDEVLSALRKPSCIRCESAWDGYHIGYRCYTCAKSEHSCICIECFNEGPSLAP